MAVANAKVPVENVLISEIEIDPKFNARSGVETGTGGPNDEKNGFEGLKNSIMTEGQDTPVILRRLAKGSKKPYFLVAGFRRIAALQAIAEEKGNKSPTVKAEVRDLTDEQARMTNVRENTARDDLSGADLCFGVGKILDSNKNLTSVQLATGLGMSQSYVNKMMNLWNKVRADVLRDWRIPPQTVTVAQMMQLVDVAKEEQREKFESFRRKDEGEKGKRGPGAWVDTAERNAAAIGTILGKLQRDNALQIVGDSFFEDNIRTLVKFKADATEVQVAKIAGSCEKAFTDAYESDESEEDKENAENKSDGAKKASAKKGSGGKAKSASAN